MFKLLRSHSQIFVSGPQRSGTRICTKMIAHDTGHRFIDETEIKELFFGRSIADANWDIISNQITAAIQKLIDTESGFVLHCPPFMPWLHRIKAPLLHSNREALVIVVRRSVVDITRSADRIGWKKGRQELEYNKMGYTRYKQKKKHKGLTKTNEPLAKLKYDCWDSCQKSRIENYREVDYESLCDHPLWVPTQNRHDFRWNQTQIT